MRLIDADALTKRLQGVLAMVEEEPNQTYANAIRHTMIDVKLSPTIDAEPVRRGRWIHDINNLYGCSECFERETMSHKKLKPYCSNCGARMDLEVQ